MRNHKIVTYLALCICLLLTCMAACSNADTLTIGINGSTWFGKTVDQAESYLEELGYKANSSNKTGLFKDHAWKFENSRLTPQTVNVWFDSDSRQVSWVACVFDKDPDLFEQIYQSLTLLCGEPNLVDQREDKQQRVTVTYPETYVWTGDSVKYNVASTNKDDDSVGTFADVLKGNTGFSVRIFQNESKESSDPTPTPSSTPKPTATPKPVNVEVSIDSVQIKDTRYGTRQFYIRFKNNASATVDRIDFLIQGYNRYGERITSYRVDTVSFYYDEEIKPGKLSPSNHYYNYYMLNEATKIKIAIQKYHTTDGRTVEVPDFQLKWSTFEK